MTFLIHALEVAIGIFAFVAVWVIYPYSFSLFELYRVSVLYVFFNRLFFSVAAGVIAFMVSVSYFQPENSHSKPEVITTDPAINLNSQKQPVNKYPSVAVQNKEYEDIIIKNSTLNFSETKTSTLSNEQLEEAENKVQYHGNDPIVRQRLGLPPKD